MAQRSLFGGNNSSSHSRSRRRKQESKPTKDFVVKGETNTISGKIDLARSTVERLLGYLKDELLCITNEEEYNKYIDRCIEDVYVGLDTETAS